MTLTMNVRGRTFQGVNKETKSGSFKSEKALAHTPSGLDFQESIGFARAAGEPRNRLLIFTFTLTNHTLMQLPPASFVIPRGRVGRVFLPRV